MSGGGWSLERTALCLEFPANREKYREIRGFSPQVPALAVVHDNDHTRLPRTPPEFSSSTEQGIITPLSGNRISLITDV